MESNGAELLINLRLVIFESRLAPSIYELYCSELFLDVCGVGQIECAEKKTGKPVISHQLKVIGKSEIEIKKDTVLGTIELATGFPQILLEAWCIV
jgi:hypothetical protein